MKFKPTNLIIAFLITIAPFFLLFAPIIINYNKSGSNTFILGKNYSHLSRSEIIYNLNSDFVLPTNLNLTFEKQNFNLNLASISAQIDTTKTTNTVLYRRLDQGIFTYVKYFFRRKNFNLNIAFNQEQFDQQIEDIISHINKPFVPTELEIKNNQINIINGSLGLFADSENVKNDIISKLTLSKFNDSIDIQTKTIGQLPNESQINETKTRAQNLINKSLILNTDLNSTVVDSKTLISWLDFDNNFQKSKIQEFSQNLSQSLRRDPVSAIFKFENGKVLEFQPSRNGIVPNVEKLTDSIINNLNSLISSKDLSLKLDIPVDTTEPVVKNNDVNSLGIKELLGSGTSSFKHSAVTRNLNISKGSSIVNRILVAPGETFSFIKSLGEVSLASGYQKAYIIRAGKTELDVGGGICQVSTTLFRAMLNSGLNITERQNHAYRVSYYEEDSKPGFDATVFIPRPDLKFTNDTAHYVLIQNILDMENRRLTYEIYGTSDGRKTEITNYRQWGSQPPPPTVWIDDPTLPVGKTIKDEQAIPGLKTSFDWIVKKADGSILHQKTFTSNFVPWAAVYRRGTKI
ncbi:MAG: VanW family protein [Candidatus Shapirobacteria bacterium]|jgi:vancomycin resistance protein YoaR